MECSTTFQGNTVALRKPSVSIQHQKMRRMSNNLQKLCMVIIHVEIELSFEVFHQKIPYVEKHSNLLTLKMILIRLEGMFTETFTMGKKLFKAEL